MNKIGKYHKPRRLANFAYAAGLISLVLVVAFSGAGGSALAAPLHATAPALGAADSFSVLAALSMSAAGAGTTVSGDLGLSPGLAVSRTGPWTVGGSQYFGPGSLAATAQTAALSAYNNLAGQGSNGTWSASPWSPAPGVWTAASDTTFSGTITLSGGYNDVWVFQVGRDMTFTGSVVMAGNAQPCNVFWQIGRDTTIASGSTFVGTLIASRDITLVSGATVGGRIISLNSSLTTDGNTITRPICLAAPTPTSTSTATATATATSTATATATSTATATRTAIAPTAIPPSLPGTGFEPGVKTILPKQPADKIYASLGDLWLEIPRLGVQLPIVGVPQTKKGWDVTWLSNQAGWLQGTAFPTWAGNSVLTGHVYDAYGNAGPFVHLNWLWYGDRIIVHAWGQQYVYEVRSVSKVTPNSVSSVIKHEELPWLTLLTCKGYDEASNSYKYRVVIRAVQVTIK